MNNAYSYLRFVAYKGIPNWSVGYIVGHSLGFTEKYPLVRIGQFIRRDKTQISICDTEEYKQITLKTNGGGAVLRGTQMGNTIGTKLQFRAKEGQFIMSKIDARNGAFGIVSKELDGAVVTGDFPLFNVNKDIISTEYLFLISTTASFVKFAQSCSRGTTNRRRIDVDLFLQQQIPLPTLSEQQALVDTYNQRLTQAQELEQLISEGGQNIEKIVNDGIGLKKTNEKKKNNTHSLLQLINYKETLTRWDPFNVKSAIISKYPICLLKDLITSIGTGTTPSTAHKEYFNGDIKFYTPADIGKDMYLGCAERTLAQPAVDDRKARLFTKGQLLFVGIGSTVGKVGIVTDDMVSANQQITGFAVNQKLANPEYVYCYLDSNKDISTAERTKTTIPVVNQSKLESVSIPLPPLSVQQQIVDEVQAQRAQLATYRAQAAHLKKEANQVFEQSIFE